jgi:hypothetical protein
MDYTPEEYATMSHHFMSLLQSDEGIEKLNEEGAAFIRSHLREVSFWRQILPPVPVRDTDLEVSTEHDTLIKIVDIEHGSTAMAINFRGRAPNRYLRGKRYAIPFFTISSERFRKSEAELRAYRYPLTKILEENSILDIQEAEDRAFVKRIRQSLAITGRQIVNTADTAVHKIPLTNLFKLLDGNRRKTSIVLMSRTMHDDILGWGSEEAGTEWVSKVTTEGFKGDRLLGHKLITTIKNDIIKANEVFIFTEPKFLGNSYILENTKFWLDKRGRIIEMEAYEDIGMGLGNINSMARLQFDKIDEDTGQPI